MKISMLLMLLLCGCAAGRIRCDSHLRPINAPAPAGARSADAITGTGH
jgi:hypothetical protein